MNKFNVTLGLLLGVFSILGGTHEAAAATAIEYNGPKIASPTTSLTAAKAQLSTSTNAQKTAAVQSATTPALKAPAGVLSTPAGQAQSAVGSGYKPVAAPKATLTR